MDDWLTRFLFRLIFIIMEFESNGIEKKIIEIPVRKTFSLESIEDWKSIQLLKLDLLFDSNILRRISILHDNCQCWEREDSSFYWCFIMSKSVIIRSQAYLWT